MNNQLQVESLDEHRYLVQAREGEDIVESLMDASPALIARLTTREPSSVPERDGTVQPDELRIIEATAAYLIPRQRAETSRRRSTSDDCAGFGLFLPLLEQPRPAAGARRRRPPEGG